MERRERDTTSSRGLDDCEAFFDVDDFELDGAEAGADDWVCFAFSGSASLWLVDDGSTRPQHEAGPLTRVDAWRASIQIDDRSAWPTSCSLSPRKIELAGWMMRSKDGETATLTYST